MLLDLPSCVCVRHETLCQEGSTLWMEADETYVCKP